MRTATCLTVGFLILSSPLVNALLAAEITPALKGSWPGFPRGLAYSVAVDGTNAYVTYLQAGLKIFDVSKPEGPHLVSAFETAGAAQKVAVGGNYAYVAEDGLNILDISNPAQPASVGKLAELGVRDVALKGNYAFLAVGSYQTGMVVADISAPASPRRVAGLQTGPANSITVAGEYAYLVHGPDGLTIVDISNPSEPRSISSIRLPGSGYDVAVLGHFAYVAGGFGGLEVIDVSNPNELRLVGGHQARGHSQAIAAAGNYVYVTDLRDGLLIYDVRDAANPQLVRKEVSSGWAQGVAVSGNYAYVAGSTRGFQVLDITNPAQSREIGAYLSDFGRGLVKIGNYIYLAEGTAGIQVIDVSDEPRPILMTNLPTAGIVDSLAVQNNHLYAGGTGGFSILDISSPTEPKVITEYQAGMGHEGVAVGFSENYAFLAEHEELAIVSITNPLRPERVGSYRTTWFASEVVVAGNYAYVADSGGMLVLDISNPANPQLTGTYETAGWPDALVIAGDYAYVVDVQDLGTSALKVLDIADPALPREVARHELPRFGYVPGLTISGNYLFLGLNSGQTEILSVLNPRTPMKVGSSPHEGADFLLQDNTLYVAAGTEGLLIFEMPPFIIDIVTEGLNVKVSWESYGRGKLQGSSGIIGVDWEDIPGTEFTNSMALPMDTGGRFFRLVK